MDFSYQIYKCFIHPSFQVSVPIVSNDRCKSMFLRAGRHEFIPDIFLCAGHEGGGQDSCQGDSGGPLQVRISILISRISRSVPPKYQAFARELNFCSHQRAYQNPTEFF